MYVSLKLTVKNPLAHRDTGSDSSDGTTAVDGVQQDNLFCLTTCNGLTLEERSYLSLVSVLSLSGLGTQAKQSNTERSYVFGLDSLRDS
jgi:hypothetical protein